jgi:flagellar motility protein MotE (MotC chaperone)
MKNMPRILPLVGIAVGGVLAINALAGAQGLPALLGGARAYAEEVVKKGAKAADAKAAKDDAATAKDATSEGKDAAAAASATTPGLSPVAKPAAVCAPTAAELAREAGLSPAELQVLQSLGERRGQLDKREGDLDTQLALMSAAESKLDAKIRALNGLKGDIQGLLTQADTKQAAEIDRLVKVFEGMKAKDAAPRMMILDDSVRVPIAAKMKERSLSAILAVMPPTEAKKLSELLALRFTNAKTQAAAAEGAAIAKAEAAAASGATMPGAVAAAPTKVAANAAAGVTAPKAAAPKKKKPAAKKKAPADGEADTEATG